MAPDVFRNKFNFLILNLFLQLLRNKVCFLCIYASDIKSIKIICDSYIESPHIVDIWPGPGVAGRRRLNDCASLLGCFLGRIVSLAAVLTFRSAWLFLTLCLILRCSRHILEADFVLVRPEVIVNNYEDFSMIR